MKFIHLTIDCNVFYTGNTDTEFESFSHHLKDSYFSTTSPITTEYLYGLETQVIHVKGDWITTSYQGTENLIEFSVSFDDLISIEDLGNHKDKLQAYSVMAEEVHQLFAKEFTTAICKREVHQFEVSAMPLTEETFDNQIMLRVEAPEYWEENSTYINILQEESIDYEVVSTKSTTSNCGATGFVMTALILLGKGVVTGVGTAIGKMSFDKVMEKMKASNETLSFNKEFMNLNLIRFQTSQIMKFPSEILNLHSFSPRDDQFVITFTAQINNNLLILDVFCTPDKNVDFIEVRELS